MSTRVILGVVLVVVGLVIIPLSGSIAKSQTESTNSFYGLRLGGGYTALARTLIIIGGLAFIVLGVLVIIKVIG